MEIEMKSSRRRFESFYPSVRPNLISKSSKRRKTINNRSISEGFNNILISNSYIKGSAMRYIIFVFYIILIIIIGVLIVYLTLIKSSLICKSDFKFQMKSSIIFDSHPRCVIIIDVNEDNQTDMIVANSGGNTIGIFLSKSDGTFTDQQTHFTGLDSRPYSIVASYFNNDSHFDIAVANYGTNNIAIFLGYGNGSFNDQIILSLGSSHPLFLSVADLNKDTLMDIIVVNSDTNNIGILLGYGNGYFKDPILYSTGYDSIPYSLAIGDLDNDNQLDIVVTNSGTNNILIFLGYNNGSFQSEQIYPTNLYSNPTSLVLVDFNNDNQLDIALTNNGTGYLGIFFGYGNGTFKEQRLYSIGMNCHPQYINVGYFNEDNLLDIVIVDSTSDRLYFLTGRGDESFPILITYDTISDSKPFWIGVSDLNNNGISDIVLVNYDANNIIRLIDFGATPLSRLIKYNVGTEGITNGVAVADFNNDEIVDIVSYTIDSIIILFGLIDGTFGNERTFFIGNQSNVQYITVGDLNNDNRTDIVICDIGYNNIGVFINYGDGNFINRNNYSTGINSNPYWIDLNDVNNDNYLDIISANRNLQNIGIFIGIGDGTFFPMIPYSTGTGSIPTSVAVNDLNNDNYSDIVVSTWNGNLIVFLGHGNNNFIIKNIYVIGSNLGPFSIALGHFNSDTYLDVVIANVYSNIATFLGDGNGGFTNKLFYTVDNNFQPLYVIIADMNNDNINDIIATDYNNDRIVIYYGLGNGTFHLGRIYSTGEGSLPYGIVVADLYNNKQLEIIVALWSIGSIAILTEYIGATFRNETIYPTGFASKSFSVAVADFNNDNRSDIVVANSGTDNLNILFGLNNGTFSIETIYSINTDSHPQYLITCDINNDNQSDIVTVNSLSNTINVIIGYPNESFAQKLIFSTGDNTYPFAITSADLNNDNRLDLITANQGTDTIGIFFGFNYTTIQSHETYYNINHKGPIGIVVNDFNNDKYLDIISTFYWTYEIGIFFGYGNGSFTDITTYSTGDRSYPWGIALGDFNNDLQLDIVVANSGTNNIGVFIGYINGSFSTILTYFIQDNSQPIAVAVTDLNNDRRLDIVVANSGTDSIGILFGYGNGSFSLVNFYSTGENTSPQSIVIADIDNDDQMDIVIANSGTNTIGILLEYTNGIFQKQISLSTGSDFLPYWVTVADFNNDNRSDIAVANSNNNSIGILLAYENKTFTPIIIYSTGSGSLPRCITITDLNNDQILDIAVVNSGTNNILVFFGFGDGSFLLGKPYSTGNATQPYGLAIGDFNNDTQIDIAVANTLANNIEIFLGYISEPFGSIKEYNTGNGSQPHSIAVGHFNNDTWLDLVVANYGSNNVGILLGKGKGIFNHIETYTTGNASAPYSVAVADFNNDQQLDIVVTNSETDNIVILLGYGNGTFQTGDIYSTGDGSRPYIIKIGDFNNDIISDIAVANSGTSNIFLLYGYGNGTFGNGTSYYLGYGYHPYSIALGNFNQDNWLDIVIACYSTDHVETLIKNC